MHLQNYLFTATIRVRILKQGWLKIYNVYAPLSIDFEEWQILSILGTVVCSKLTPMHHCGIISSHLSATVATDLNTANLGSIPAATHISHW